MKLILILLLAAVGFQANGFAAGDDWAAKMKSAMPEQLTVEPKQPRRALVFSVTPGYKHAVIPQVKEVFATMAEKTKVCEFVISDDVSMFEPETLNTFDALIFNNTCAGRKERHLFKDVLITQVEKYGGKYKGLSEKERLAKAQTFEQAVLDFVASGKGLMVVHGGITMMNQSKAYSTMIGASFAYHPKFQTITVELVEPEHPLLKGFKGKSFVHDNEPYIFNGAYADKNFRPLLKMNTRALVGVKAEIHADVRYSSWIRAHHKGRVFYSSSSHGKESYTRPELLQFYLDGLQYVLGDLECDDSVPAK